MLQEVTVLFIYFRYLDPTVQPNGGPKAAHCSSPLYLHFILTTTTLWVTLGWPKKTQWVSMSEWRFYPASQILVQHSNHDHMLVFRPLINWGKPTVPQPKSTFPSLQNAENSTGLPYRHAARMVTISFWLQHCCADAAKHYSHLKSYAWYLIHLCLVILYRKECLDEQTT